MFAHIQPAKPSGSIMVPPSKSMAHRLLMAAGLAAGTSYVENLALSNDVQVTLNGLRQLGADITLDGGTAAVHGLPCFAPVTQPVDCGESGSTLRFFVPVFSLTGAPVTFRGAPRLMQRPQGVYAELFAQQHLHFDQKEETLTINGALTAGEYTVAGNVSSQFITGLLYALPLCNGDSILYITPPLESRSYIELTLAALAAFGVQAVFTNAFTISIKGNQKYFACNCTVEGDYSQAAFWLVLGSVLGGVGVKGLAENSRQGDKVITDILTRCGAALHTENKVLRCEAAPLTATEIDLADCPDLGPIVMVLALFCSGETCIKNAARLRMKESDRIAAMQQEIAKMGGEIFADENTVAIKACALHGAKTLCSHNDHRIAMALAVAAVCAGVPVTISGAEAVNKSYPDFWQHLASLGVEVELYEE